MRKQSICISKEKKTEIDTKGKKTLMLKRLLRSICGGKRLYGESKTLLSVLITSFILIHFNQIFEQSNVYEGGWEGTTS